MGRKIKNRVAYYKRVRFSDSTVTLQNTLSAALQKLKSADERREQFTDDADIFRLINRSRVQANILFGQFVVFEPNKQQAYLKLEPGKEFYEIDSHTLGEREAFADEVYYFGVRDNDLVCLQTRSIREKHLEAHLHWLLTTQTSYVGDNVTLEITNQPKAETYRSVGRRSAKSIKIGTHVFSEKRYSQEPYRKERKIYDITGKAHDLILAAIGTKEYEKIRGLENDLDESNLEVILQVKFNRKTTHSGQEVLDRIASSFRHLDGVDYEVEFKGGGRIKGDDMKISAPIQMQLLENGLVDETDLYKQMHQFLISILLN